MITAGVFIADGNVCKWSGGSHRLKILVQVPTMLPKWDILSMPCNTGTLVHVFGVLKSVQLCIFLLLRTKSILCFIPLPFLIFLLEWQIFSLLRRLSTISVATCMEEASRVVSC